MQQGDGRLTEIMLGTDGIAGRIVCAPELIPGPGQYVLAQDGSDAPLPVPVFIYAAAPGGFLAAAPLPEDWAPGTALQLRGPQGRGLSLPVVARRVVLAAPHRSAARLLPLVAPALRQGAAVTIVSLQVPDDLPGEVEIQPPADLQGAAAWADYIAVDVEREALPELGAILRTAAASVQVLVSCPMACGGLAECGVCAVSDSAGWKMACKDGPVFDLRDLLS